MARDRGRNRDTKDMCPMGDESCKGTPEIKDVPRKDRPEDKRMRCEFVNDTGLLPNENYNPQHEPDTIPGPAQVEYMDAKILTLPIIPNSMRNSIPRGFVNFVDEIRSRDLATPPYTPEEVAVLALNGRSVRIACNEIIRACRYAKARFHYGFSETRCADLVGLADYSSHNSNGWIWHDLMDDMEWAEIHDALYALFKDVEEDVMYFDLPIIGEDDELYAKVYTDSCQSSALFAFLAPKLPLYQVSSSGTKVELTGMFLELQCLKPTVTSVADLKTALRSDIASLRNMLVQYNTSPGTLIRRDVAFKKGIAASNNPYGVCLPFMKEFVGNEMDAHLPIATSPIVSDVDDLKSMACKLSHATPAYVFLDNCTVVEEIDFATMLVTNKITDTEGLTFTWTDPPSDQKGYKLNTGGKCLTRDERSEMTHLMVPTNVTRDVHVTDKDLIINVLENRGTFVIDVQCVVAGSVENRLVRYSSVTNMMNNSNSSNQGLALQASIMLFLTKVKMVVTPEFVVPVNINIFGGTVYAVNTDNYRMMRSEDPEWIRKKLLRAIASDAARDVFLIQDMRPSIGCDGPSNPETL